ncbi:MAG: asparagine synthase (glutamine-hydrolyzing) [Cyclobacteriaceae bacterium]
MCGIAGLLYFREKMVVDHELLVAMRDTMFHRGPDDAGVFIDKEVGLAHRRLSIIDLSEKGKQPFHSADNRYTITFNGEIFNYKELRKELEATGARFVSDSDTEVLLQLFIVYGEGCLEKLNGMFAFAIWDSFKRELFLARDRVGIKPLYYSIYNNSFFFGSEPKALFKVGVDHQVNIGVMPELLLFKYVAGENTVFRHVKRLLPGHFMTVKDGKHQVTRWWNLPEIIKKNREQLPNKPFEWFEDIFYSSVKYRTISDVPVGVMLSGGLDSSSIAAALHRNGETNMTAFTFVFDDPLYNEGPLASQVANKFGLKLNEIELAAEDLTKALSEAAWLYDEPLVHQNDAQMLALSKAAKKQVSVLLSGEGADEFMGGYVRYKPLNYYRFLRLAGMSTRFLKYANTGGIVNRFDKLNRYLTDDRIKSLVLLNASSVFPSDLMKYGISVDISSFAYRNTVLKEAIDLYPSEPARQAMYMDLFIHMSSVLDRNDRMTMGASIECRVPFLDYRLMEMVPALPTKNLLKGKKGKYLLYNSVARQLPTSVLSFKKLGFSVPWDEYMKKDEKFRESLSQIESGSLMEFFPELNINKLLNEYKSDNNFASTMLKQLLMVNNWKESYLDRI